MTYHTPTPCRAYLVGFTDRHLHVKGESGQTYQIFRDTISQMRMLDKITVEFTTDLMEVMVKNAGEICR